MKEYDYYTRRNHAKLSLAWKWISKFRPDVREAILAEVNRQFPVDGQKQGEIELPKSLEKMK